MNASRQAPQIIVAGHVSLDIYPGLSDVTDGVKGLIVPGKLINIGPVLTSTGGSVSNTGRALRRLDVPVRLMGKVGDDAFGMMIAEIMHRHDPALSENMIVTPGEHTSYTICINIPGMDRCFWHCPGANDTFVADDVNVETLAGARFFHFGYPPLMKRMYADDGAQLALLLSRVKGKGLTTSLDMSRPDPSSESGRIDWPALLKNVLPHVDVFTPSVDELLFMLDRPTFDALFADGKDGEQSLTAEMLHGLSDRLLEMGSAVVMMKLGEQGIYLRTTADAERLKAMGNGAPPDTASWLDRELLAPCFQVNVAGTTGSGDCTIAGFLAALAHDLPPEQAATTAVAVGACSVEQTDPTSGVPTWDVAQQRLAKPWPRLATAVAMKNWKFLDDAGLYISPNDDQ